jgi:peptidoglycan DL-endopeptidase CwlO
VASFVLRDPTRGYLYPPPPRRASAGGGLAALLAVTVLAALAAPHAHALRPQVQAVRSVLAGNGLPEFPAVRLPQLPRPASPPARVARPSPRAARAVAYALAQRGKPYRWAAAGPAAFDCSGLTWAAWRAAGVTIPRTAAGQLTGLPPARGPLRPGDLLIYRTDGPSRRHVAIVVDRGRMVEARGRGIPVRSTVIRRDYLGAIRPGAGR